MGQPNPNHNYGTNSKMGQPQTRITQPQPQKWDKLKNVTTNRRNVANSKMGQPHPQPSGMRIDDPQDRDTEGCGPQG